MEENVLKDFETFSEFPEKYLKVSNNSIYYLIITQKESFVARKNLDSISIINVLNEQKLVIQKSYYDINTGNLVLNTKSVSDVDGNNEVLIDDEKNIKVISLRAILNITENEVYYLSKEDIEVLVNFKEENAKTYGMKPRKNYFKKKKLC